MCSLRTVDMFTAVANPTRRAMLKRLRGREMTVAELARPFRMTMPAISQHLRVLREVKLVRSRRVGRQRAYRFDEKSLRPLTKWLDDHVTKSLNNRIGRRCTAGLISRRHHQLRGWEVHDWDRRRLKVDQVLVIEAAGKTACFPRRRWSMRMTQEDQTRLVSMRIQEKRPGSN